MNDQISFKEKLKIEERRLQSKLDNIRRAIKILDSNSYIDKVLEDFIKSEIIQEKH